MAYKLKDIDLLQIIDDLSKESGEKFIDIEEVSQRVEFSERTYSFKLLVALEMLGLIARSADRTKVQLIGSVLKWEPRFPAEWEYDVARILAWLEKRSSGGIGARG